MYELKDVIVGNDLNDIYSNVSTNFKSSIKLNHRFKNEIENIYARTLLNLGRSALCLFHLKYINMFERLAEYYGDDEELVKFSEDLISIINDYFEDLDSNLNIKTKHDLDNLNYILNISLFLLNEVVNEKNIELAYESFFQIERKINKKNLYKKESDILFNNVESISIIKINMNLRENTLGEVYYEV